MSLILIYPSADNPQDNQRLDEVLAHALAGVEHRTVTHAAELSGLQGQTLLFSVPLGEYGVNLEYVSMLRRLRAQSDLLEGCLAGIS